MKVTAFVRAERAVYVLVDRKPISEHSSRAEAIAEADRLRSWLDGPDSEAARAARGEGTYFPPVAWLSIPAEEWRRFVGAESEGE